MRLSHAPARLVGLALIAAIGCGSSPGKLTGKVTYQGTALKGGTVTLVPNASGKTYSTRINEDGTYSLDQVEAGTYKVCVETSSLKPDGNAAPTDPRIKNVPPPGANVPEGYAMASPGGAKQSQRYVAIPPKYEKPSETPLTVEVKGGTQQHDIPLS
jgi:hypothetical protein